MGVLLNDQLLICPTVHAPLIDVLLQFHQPRVALTMDINRMYYAVRLPEAQHDFHRFVWRMYKPGKPKEYDEAHVRCISFLIRGEHGGKDEKHAKWTETPWAVLAVQKFFYLDDRLKGASYVSEAIKLQKELQQLLLRKWKLNESEALCHLPEHLVEQGTTRELTAADESTKVLGIDQNKESDSLRLTMSIASS